MISAPGLWISSALIKTPGPNRCLLLGSNRLPAKEAALIIKI